MSNNYDVTDRDAMNRMLQLHIDFGPTASIIVGASDSLEHYQLLVHDSDDFQKPFNLPLGYSNDAGAEIAGESFAKQLRGKAIRGFEIVNGGSMVFDNAEPPLIKEVSPLSEDFVNALESKIKYNMEDMN